MTTKQEKTGPALLVVDKAMFDECDNIYQLLKGEGHRGACAGMIAIKAGLSKVPALEKAARQLEDALYTTAADLTTLAERIKKEADYISQLFPH